MDEELVEARTSYQVWGRAFEMMGRGLREVRINVAKDVWCVPNRCAIKMRIVKIAGMAKEGSAGRARVRIDGGCLLHAEQRFFEEGVPGVVPKLLGWPFETFGGGRATKEQIESELQVLRERLGDELVSQLMGGRKI